MSDLAKIMLGDVGAVKIPTKMVEVLDTDSIINQVLEKGQVIYFDPEGFANKKIKPVYVAALRRNIRLVMRNHTKVGKSVFAVTLARDDVIAPTGAGRPRKGSK